MLMGTGLLSQQLSSMYAAMANHGACSGAHSPAILQQRHAVLLAPQQRERGRRNVRGGEAGLCQLVALAAVLDEAVGQRHGPELQPAIQQALQRQIVHHCASHDGSEAVAVLHIT